jgi:hypothetical protein
MPDQDSGIPENDEQENPIDEAYCDLAFLAMYIDSVKRELARRNNGEPASMSDAALCGYAHRAKELAGRINHILQHAIGDESLA